MGFAAKKGETPSVVQAEGERLRVSFSFHPKKVSFIKGVKGARYDAASRTWTVPASALDTLRSSHYFLPSTTTYIETPFSKENREIVAKNPFEVPADILNNSGVDVAVTLDSSRSHIIVSANGASRARRFIQTHDGLTYSKSEKGFVIGAQLLPSLIRELRLKGYTFGVEEELGKALKESANLRNEIVSGKIQRPTAEELSSALLCPILDFIDGEFLIAKCHREALKYFFPEIRSITIRKAKAGSIASKGEVSEIAVRALKAGVQLWFTGNAKEEFLRGGFCELKDGFDDGAAVISPTLLAFVYIGRPLLLVREDIEQEIAPLKLKKDSSILASSLPAGVKAYLIPTNGDQDLLSKIASIGEAKTNSPVPRSRSLLDWLGNLQSQRELRGRALEFQSLPDASPDLQNTELKAKLFPHQRVAVKWILEQEAGLLGDDMGLGKTLSVLASFEELKALGKSDFILVVSPMSLVRNWLREARGWTPSLRLSSLPEGKSNRDRALRDLDRYGSTHLDGLVLNYETLRIETVHPIIAKITSTRKTLLCVDESHRVKNPQSKSFQALRGIAERAPRRLLLTGTPIPRDIADIWGQMLLIDRGERLGTKYYEWLSKVAELGTRWSEYAIKKYRKEGIGETISRVQEVLLRRAKEDVIDLPPKLFSVRDVDLTGDQLQRYEAVRKDLLVRVSSCSGEVFQKEIGNILEEYLRAVQIASNPRLVDETWKGDPAKFLELDTIVSDIVHERGEKLIIWSSFRRNIEELCERYRRYRPVKIYGGIGADARAKAVSEFQSERKDSSKIFIGNPAAAGVGLTLTAARTAVYLDKTWNAGDYLQSIDRVHRIGQRGTVTIISLHSSLVDELIARNLAKKERTQRSLLEGKAESGVSAPTREELLDALR